MLPEATPGPVAGSLTVAALTPGASAPAQTPVIVQPAGTTPAAASVSLAEQPAPASRAATETVPQSTGTIRPGGPPVAVTTTVPGQKVRLSFEGTAGQLVSLTQQDSAGQPGPSTRAGCLNEYTDLLRPDGQNLASTNSCAPVGATRLPVSGTYTIEIQMIDSSTADFTLILHDVPP